MQFDVAVIGGGPAGVSAAMASAKQGMKTVLCTDRPVLGGNSSSEIRVWTRGATGAGNLFAEEMGTLGELKLKNLAVNKDGNVWGWDDVLLDAVLAQPELTLFLNLPITRVETDGDGKITAVSGEQMASGKAVDIQAKVYIDCTGDGEIAYRVGVPFRMGREGRDVFSEDMAGALSDHKVLGSSILWQTKRMPHPVPYTAPSYAMSLAEVETLIHQGGRILSADMQGSDCWWFELGGCLDTILDSQEIHFELRRVVMGIWNYIKNSGHFDADCLELEWIGSIPGKRESRRFIGMHTLVQDDIRRNAFADQAVAYGGWYMDAHPAKGIFSQKDSCVQIALSCYGIPLSCFFHPDYPNLFFAGRAASTSHLAFTSYRIMNTCALTGDACGIAASLCVREGRSAEQIWASSRHQLMEILAREDVVFQHEPQPGPLALATATASSEHAHEAEPSDQRLSLRGDVYVCVPASDEKAEIRLYARAACRVAYRVCTQALPSRLVAGDVLLEGSWDVTPGPQWVSVALPKGDGFSMIWLQDAPEAELCLGERLCGVCAGRRDDSALYAPCVRWPGVYQAAQVLSGPTRPYEGANGWMCAENTGWLRLTLPKAEPVDTLRLYFDADFSAELTSSRCATWSDFHRYHARQAMPGQLIKDYDLLLDGVLLESVRGNTRRMAVHAFPRQAVKEITVKILQTYGDRPVMYRVLAQ